LNLPNDLTQLLQDVAAFTGNAPPSWLTAEAPLLADPEPFYLVGLIGGKEVGKSALVNALVGHDITAQTSFGPGTETVIAYAHTSQVAPLRALLEAEVPGRFQIVEHALPHLASQVLLDLPDIDSHWGDHVAVTRKILRHMLFPVWVQSIEKYADRQPQDLLLRVAAGNAPGNFVFCLNKVDQIDRLGPAAIAELKDDYSVRLQRVLQLETAPKVWPIAAIHPDRFEMPALRDLLAKQKTEETIRTSRAGAAARQKASVVAWLTAQDLHARADRLKRLEDEADDFINERLGGPLLEGLLPQLLDDPSYRHAVIDDCMAKRIGHWPILNILHPLFASIGAFFRRNTEAKARPLTMPTGEAMVDQQLADLTHEGSAGRPLADRVQTTFALLQQTHPALSNLYRSRKLWEPVPATEAVGELRDALVATINRQRSAACSRIDSPGPAGAFFRALLTIGAIIWFPFLQPIIHTLQVNLTTTDPAQHRNIAALLVDLLSLNNFLQSLTGLLLYFLVLWLILRWATQRRVLRQFTKWKQADADEADLSLTRKIVDWLGGLAEPVRTSRENVEALARRVGEIQNPKSKIQTKAETETPKARIA
jgi:hypothetical protein